MQSKGRICNKHISIKHFWCSPHSRLSSHSSSFKNTLHTVHFRAKITCCLSCLTHQKFQFILPEQVLLTKANLCVWEGGGALLNSHTVQEMLCKFKNAHCHLHSLSCTITYGCFKWNTHFPCKVSTNNMKRTKCTMCITSFNEVKLL